MSECGLIWVGRVALFDNAHFNSLVKECNFSKMSKRSLVF